MFGNIFRNKEIRKKLGPCPVCGSQGWRPSDIAKDMLACPVCGSQLVIGHGPIR
jgi:ssDNA-binding Zn-finger/Zn-ribbon topoisomerase 1